MAALIAVLVFLLSVSEGCAQDALHSDFSLDSSELREITAGLPGDARKRILDQAGEFLDLMAKTLDGPQDLLLLVDKRNALPSESIPPDLTALDRYSLVLNKKGLLLRLELIPDLLEMADAARAQGSPLPISSTYRSYASQAVLYRNELKTKSREEVEKELAPPGHSQHQLGTAIDFGSIDLSFAATAAGRWLFANAWKFGFSLSYPENSVDETGYSYEPWHYRYVGRSAAGLIQSFFGGSQQIFLEFYAEKHGVFSQSRVRQTGEAVTPNRRMGRSDPPA